MTQAPIARISFLTVLTVISLMLLIYLQPAFASQVTTERIFSLPDYSASSQDTPATMGPSGEGTGQSSGSVDGQSQPTAPAIGAEGEILSDQTGDDPALITPPLNILSGTDQLPAPVQRMHQAIYEAALSGNIENLRLPIEMNELPPIIGLDGGVGDPIAQLQDLSGDAQGSEILAILAEILESGFVHVEPNTPQEMYVWPYFAHYPLNALDDRQRVELFRLLTAGDFEQMDAIGHYVFFRLGIGPDGTWHYFVAGE